MRKLSIYVAKYGSDAGPKLYHLLQSQAAHASVSARLRSKIEALTGHPVRARSSRPHPETPLPLFPEPSPNADPLA